MHHVQRKEARGRHRYVSHAPLEKTVNTQDGCQNRRVKDLVRHSRILFRTHVPQGRVPRQNLARELSKVFFLTKQGKRLRNGNAPTV